MSEKQQVERAKYILVPVWAVWVGGAALTLTIVLMLGTLLGELVQACR